MQVKANQLIEFSFCTADSATGNGLDPTTLGTATTGKLYINGVQNAAVVTLSDEVGTSGITKVSYTVPGTVVEGNTVQCIITATVNGIVASWPVREDEVVTATRAAGDYPTSIAYNAHGDISAVNWYSGKTWTYAYNTSYQLTGITEA
jgi:multidrug efflux pump subunit AcrA (membrane-fusion protein)